MALAGVLNGGGPAPRAQVLLLHSSSGHYGADRQLALLATGLDPDRYRPIVVLPPGDLAGDLRAAGAEVIERSPAVIRRGAGTPRGIASLAVAAARDGAALGRLIRRRRVALVHSNTSVLLSGAVAAAAARVPHVWHVRELYSRYATLWPVYRRMLRSAAALPCVSCVYGAADVVAVPSTVPDPLPNTALEAAAAGCAVVGAAHGGLPEIIRDGDTGRLLRPGDAAGLAEVVAALLDDEGERERLGAAAAADARARFDPGRLVAEMQSLYDAVR